MCGYNLTDFWLQYFSNYCMTKGYQQSFATQLHLLNVIKILSITSNAHLHHTKSIIKPHLLHFDED